MNFGNNSMLGILHQSAANGDEDSLFRLAKMYETGFGGVELNLPKACELMDRFVTAYRSSSRSKKCRGIGSLPASSVQLRSLSFGGQELCKLGPSTGAAPFFAQHRQGTGIIRAIRGAGTYAINIFLGEYVHDGSAPRNKSE